MLVLTPRQIRSSWIVVTALISEFQTTRIVRYRGKLYPALSLDHTQSNGTCPPSSRRCRNLDFFQPGVLELDPILVSYVPSSTRFTLVRCNRARHRRRY